MVECGNLASLETGFSWNRGKSPKDSNHTNTIDRQKKTLMN